MLVAGCAAFAVLAAWAGAARLGRDVLAALPALPAMIGVHLVQLFLCGEAWRAALGEGPAGGAMLRVRLVREGVNSLLPVAHVGGELVGARLLARGGVPPSLAGAGTVLDLTLEAGTLLPFALAGALLLSALTADRSWLPWIGGGLLTAAAGVLAFGLAQRAGLLRLVETGLARLGRRFPTLAVEGLAGLHAALRARARDRRAVLRGGLLHLLAWGLGTAEVMLALAALGRPVDVATAFVIEGLGMAARGAGFAVPGAVGVQEGGLVLVCGLLGVPAEAALALSVLKRLREVIVGFAGLLLWHRAERRPAAG